MKTFFIAFLGTFLVSSTLYLFAISRVDPLWYFNGNVSGLHVFTDEPYNLPFDERLQKTNQYQAGKYDCLILGSSRTVLLHASAFKKWKCFNYAISGGNMAEFINIVQYVEKRHGERPQRLIIGLDETAYRGDINRNPPFLKNFEPPPSFIEKYFNLDSLILSFKVIANHKNGYAYGRRFYDRNLESVVGTPYSPNDRAQCYHFFRWNVKQPVIDSYVERLQQLKDRGYALYGFTTPLPATDVTLFYESSASRGVKEASWKLAQVFDRFVDYTAPNPINEDEAAFYNSKHSRPENLDPIPADLEGEKVVTGIDVGKQPTLEAYIAKTVDRSKQQRINRDIPDCRLLAKRQKK